MKPLLIVLGLFALACGRSVSSDRQPVGQGTSKQQPSTFETAAVTARKLDTAVRLPAEITPYEGVAVYPRVSAFVDEMLVDRGSRVRPGDVLARLSAPELVAQRAEAQAKTAADASTFQRLSGASRTPGAVAKNDVELAEKALRSDEERVKAVQTLEGYLTVKAPFDGVVTERNVHPGALVGPPAGQNAIPIVRIEQVDHLRLTVPVPEADIAGIAEGEAASFRVRAWPGEPFSGVIKRVSRSVDVRTRTMPVELDVENTSGRLAPGMFVEVLWPVKRSSPTLFVPVSAVVQTTEGIFVDRVREGIVEQVTVERGATTADGLVEVFGELAPGDVVLRRGSEELQNGSRIATRSVDEAGNDDKRD